MGFEDIVGQDVVLKAIQGAVLNDRVGHAYLFSGPRGSGKKTLAGLFARTLNCGAEREEIPCGRCPSCRKIAGGVHPDIHELKPEGASLKIGQFRAIKESLFYFPREGIRKVCLVHEADLMTLPAANSILKILEEPPRDLVFILLSSRPWALLPTVVSRCAHFPLKPLGREELVRLLEGRTALAAREKEMVTDFAGGNPGRALEMAAGGDWMKRYEEALEVVEELETASAEAVFNRAEELSSREDLPDILDMLIAIYRERLIGCLEACGDEEVNEGGAHFPHTGGQKKGKETRRPKRPLSGEKICRELLKVRDQLPQNVNRRLALETLFLKVRGVV